MIILEYNIDLNNHPLILYFHTGDTGVCRSLTSIARSIAAASQTDLKAGNFQGSERGFIDLLMKDFLNHFSAFSHPICRPYILTIETMWHTMSKAENCHQFWTHKVSQSLIPNIDTSISKLVHWVALFLQYTVGFNKFYLDSSLMKQFELWEHASYIKQAKTTHKNEPRNL